MKRIALYAGSFDPPTNGHLWMIRQGAALFDELIVVLAVNPDKQGQHLLSAETRERLLNSMAEEFCGKVRVARVEKAFLVDYARSLGAGYLLRGIRNNKDLEYEKDMARMNARMEPGVHSVFLMPPPELEDISSTLVRGFLGFRDWERWVRACVPPCVYDAVAAAPDKNS